MLQVLEELEDVRIGQQRGGQTSRLGRKNALDVVWSNTLVIATLFSYLCINIWHNLTHPTSGVLVRTPCLITLNPNFLGWQRLSWRGNTWLLKLWLMSRNKHSAFTHPHLVKLGCERVIPTGLPSFVWWGWANECFWLLCEYATFSIKRLWFWDFVFDSTQLKLPFSCVIKSQVSQVVGQPFGHSVSKKERSCHKCQLTSAVWFIYQDDHSVWPAGMTPQSEWETRCRLEWWHIGALYLSRNSKALATTI